MTPIRNARKQVRPNRRAALAPTRIAVRGKREQHSTLQKRVAGTRNESGRQKRETGTGAAVIGPDEPRGGVRLITRAGSDSFTLSAEARHTQMLKSRAGTGHPPGTGLYW